MRTVHFRLKALGVVALALCAFFSLLLLIFRPFAIGGIGRKLITFGRSAEVGLDRNEIARGKELEHGEAQAEALVQRPPDEMIIGRDVNVRKEMEKLRAKEWDDVVKMENGTGLEEAGKKVLAKPPKPDDEEVENGQKYPFLERISIYPYLKLYVSKS